MLVKIIAVGLITIHVRKHGEIYLGICRKYYTRNTYLRHDNANSASLRISRFNLDALQLFRWVFAEQSLNQVDTLKEFVASAFARYIEIIWVVTS